MKVALNTINQTNLISNQIYSISKGSVEVNMSEDIVITNLSKIVLEMSSPEINIKVLLKESLNCDGQQLHGYQQNKQSPIT